MITPTELVEAAEHSVLCAAIADPFEATNFGLAAWQFQGAPARFIWNTINELTGSNQLADNWNLRAALLDDHAALALYDRLCRSTAPSGLELQRAAEVVKEAATRRGLERLAQEIPKELSAGANVLSITDRVRSFLDRIEAGTGLNEKSSTTLDIEVVAELARITEDLAGLAAGKPIQTGLPTGLGLERYVPGGLPKDRVTLVFGDTGTFKTAVKQQLSDSIAASGAYVLDFTLEDSAELTAQRFIARHTGIPYGRIAARALVPAEVEQIKRLLPVAELVAARTIVVGNVPATVEEAIRLSRYWARKVPLKAVFLDYIQLIEQPASSSEAFAVKETMKKIQRAAFRDKLSWVVLSQINRDFNHRDDRRPQLTDLYGGSAIGQLVKLAIGIFRPSIYEPVPESESIWSEMYVNDPAGKERYRGALELWIRKCVNGESNVCVPVTVDPGTGRFTVI